MTTGVSRALVPDEVVGELAALEQVRRAVLDAGRTPELWSARGRELVLAALERVCDAAAVAKARVLTAEQKAGTWALKGDRDLAGWVGRTSRQGRGAGLGQVGQAATLAAMPQVAEAMVEGSVTAKHVAEITRATGASAPLAAELATPAGQARVVDLAGRLDGSHFGTALRQMAASLDPAGRQREHDEQRRSRFVQVSHGAGGTTFNGRLDSISGHEFAKALDALNPRPAQDDDRSRPQRLADALSAMVRRVLTDKTTTPDAIAPVQALITFSEQTWTALRGTGDTLRGTGDTLRGTGDNPNARASKGSTADVITALRGTNPVSDETGQSWPASELGRALCDCDLTRAVLDAKGAVLELGRARRYFTKSHWLALYASGQTTCAVAGCDMPLRFTELHHMLWWDEHHGPTDLANVAPECAFHHHDIHKNDIRVTRRPDGTYQHHWPDGRPYGGTPPNPPPGKEPPGAAPSNRRVPHGETPPGEIPPGKAPPDRRVPHDGTPPGVTPRGEAPPDRRAPHGEGPSNRRAPHGAPPHRARSDAARSDAPARAHTDAPCEQAAL